MIIIFKDGDTYKAEEFYKSTKNLFKEFVSAEMIGSKNTANYNLTLTDKYGGKIIFLSGVTSGYSGNGPEATISILKDAGFEFQNSFIEENINFNLEK